MKEEREKIVGLLLEDFLGWGMGTIRNLAEQAYIYGQSEAFGRGRAEGQEARQKLYAESCAHMTKWQKDREAIMRMTPGYDYKNRVDDEEWAKAIKALAAALRAAGVGEELDR